MLVIAIAAFSIDELLLVDDEEEKKLTAYTERSMVAIIATVRIRPEIIAPTIFLTGQLFLEPDLMLLINTTNEAINAPISSAYTIMINGYNNANIIPILFTFQYMLVGYNYITQERPLITHINRGFLPLTY